MRRGEGWESGVAARERVIFESLESFFRPNELDCFRLPPSAPSATFSTLSVRGVLLPLLRLPRPKEDESLRPEERGDSTGCHVTVM